MKAKFAKKENLFCMRQFYTLYETSFQIFPFFFPKDSKNLTSCDIGLREVGAKRHLNIVRKERKICEKLFLAVAIFYSFELNCSNLRPFLSINFPQ